MFNKGDRVMWVPTDCPQCGPTSTDQEFMQETVYVVATVYTDVDSHCVGLVIEGKEICPCCGGEAVWCSCEFRKLVDMDNREWFRETIKNHAHKPVKVPEPA